jgi:predicted dehydrogenase
MIGCGNIAPAYVRGCRHFSSILDLVACADINPAAAKALARKSGDGLRAVSVEKLLADPEIQIVVNLTIPKVHAEVSLAILEAGKHVHSEKPLAVTREEGQKVLKAAAANGLRVGCAPDTFLGGGIQTCRQLLADGVIGEPVAAVSFFAGHGPESWHPNPFIFYATGAGPMFDLGPYYLTTLVALLGPVRRVAGAARISFPERIATSPALNGTRIPVEVPTHVTAALDFAAGPVGTLITSFDVWAHSLPRIEIYGSEGTLSVPDPNTFVGPARVWTTTDREWREVPLTHSDQVGRGIGVADMAYAIQSGRAHRASGALAYHVLDLMSSIIEASECGAHTELASSCDQPAPLPVGLAEGKLDA